MHSFVRTSCTGLLIGGIVALASCGGDDTTTGSTGTAGSAGTAGSSSNSGGSQGTAGTPVTSGSGGTATGAGGSAGGAAGSSAGAGGSAGSILDSGAGSGDAKADTGGGSDASVGYNPCPSKGGAADGGTVPCAVMGLGDSITAGANSTASGSYRTFLYQLALGHQQTITLVGGNMFGPDTVKNPLTNMMVPFPKGNEGYSGYTIDKGGRPGIHELIAHAMQTSHPHIITLMIGTNDVDTNDDLANAPMRLGGLLDTIIATDPTVLVVLAQIVPTTDDAENVRVKAYNDAMPALVKARTDAGKHVVLVDMYDAFLAHAGYKADYMNNDKLHPNDTGYSKMADVWYAAIGPLFR